MHPLLKKILDPPLRSHEPETRMDVIVHAKCLGNSLHPFVILTRLETGDLSMFNICSERFSGPLGGQFCRQSPWKERFS